MSTSPFPDPFQLWREALTKLEGNVNSLVTGSMDSQDMMRSVHQLSALSLGMQQAFEKAIGAYFAKINLPSRKDVTELAAALQRVEDKLDRLLPASAAASASARRAAAPGAHPASAGCRRTDARRCACRRTAAAETGEGQDGAHAAQELSDGDRDEERQARRAGARRAAAPGGRARASSAA